MAGFTSFASTAMQALSLVNSISGGNNDSANRDYKQLEQRNALELKNLSQNNELQKEQIRISAEQAETERRTALRRLMARQRAQFGASGIETGTGSGQAVLLGLFEESDEERRQREALDALKAGALDQTYQNQSRVNTLQLTQLKERNKMKKTGSILESLTSIF